MSCSSFDANPVDAADASTDAAQDSPANDGDGGPGVVQKKACSVTSTGGITGVLTYPASGTKPWIVPEAGAEADGVSAQVTLDPGERSSVLALTHVDGFAAIPDDSEVLGVVATMKHEGTAGIQDERVSLADSGDILVRQDKKKASPWPGQLVPTTYGGPSDLWGERYKPADIRDTGFGLGVEVKNTGATSATASVDGMSVTVFYTCPQ